jgi:hypothetical protein
MITDPGAASVRPTDDVDLAVEVTCRGFYGGGGECIGVEFGEVDQHRVRASRFDRT